MVPVVDGNGVVRVVRALGVDHIATLAAADVTGDVVTRIPQTEGFAEKLARPAGDVEMLIGMDNQGWMPVPVESSQLARDNLRLMQSVLSPHCILMGSVSGEALRGVMSACLRLSSSQVGGDQGFSSEAACEP